MDSELEPIPKKISDKRDQILKPGSIWRKDHGIIGIADIILGFQFMLHELIEFVHVDVHE